MYYNPPKNNTLGFLVPWLKLARGVLFWGKSIFFNYGKIRPKKTFPQEGLKQDPKTNFFGNERKLKIVSKMLVSAHVKWARKSKNVKESPSLGILTFWKVYFLDFPKKNPKGGFIWGGHQRSGLKPPQNMTQVSFLGLLLETSWGSLVFRIFSSPTWAPKKDQFPGSQKKNT